MRHFADQGIQLMVACSFAKNMGLYGTSQTHNRQGEACLRSLYLPTLSQTHTADPSDSGGGVMPDTAQQAAQPPSFRPLTPPTLLVVQASVWAPFTCCASRVRRPTRSSHTSRYYLPPPFSSPLLLLLLLSLGGRHALTPPPPLLLSAAAQAIIRPMYSSPPCHYAKVAALILTDPELYLKWCGP